LTHIDIFTGIGGFIEAAALAGLETVACCEIDEKLRKYLEKTYRITAYGDIRKFNAKAYNWVEILTGGTPCQPASLAGRRKGTKDNRWLWPEAVRITSEIRPLGFVFENPIGIRSMGLDGICAELEALGYEIQLLNIPACAVNAPHRRKRYWITGLLADSDSLRKRKQTGAQSKIGIWAYNSGKTDKTRIPANTDSLKRRPEPHCNSQGHETRLKPQRGGTTDKTVTCRNSDSLPEHGDDRELREDTPSRLTDETDSSDDSDIERLEGFAGDVNEAGEKQKTDRPASPPDIQFLDYRIVPRWTGREWVASRVAGAFDGMDDGAGDRKLIEALGNMICVPVAAEILKAMKKAIGQGKCMKIKKAMK